MEASARARVVGVDGERDGGDDRRSGCRGRSLSLGLPSMAALHQRVEDLEVDRLDKISELGEERFTGNVRRTSAAGRTRLGLLRSISRERAR